MPVIERPDISGPVPAPGSPGILVPVEYSREIIRGAIEGSFSLRNFRRQRMGAGIVAMPVMAALPVADWVDESPLTGTGSDKTKKPTTEAGWKTAILRAEECAAIVVVPEAVVFDAQVDLFGELRPILTEALGKVVDEAVLFGGTGTHKKPASWANGIVAQAAATNSVPEGATPEEFAAAVSDAMALLEADGLSPNLIGGGPTLAGKFRSMTATDGRPLYFDTIRAGGTATALWGTTIDIVRNGAWDNAVATACVFDSNNIVVGVREDINFKVLTEATIDVSPARDGSALVYLAQQDCVALRVRYRVAWTEVQPVTQLGSGLPAAAVIPPAGP